jgi:hypothetical protein
MRTCRRFERIKARAEREIAFHTAHPAQHAGEQSAKRSAAMAVLARQRMGRALAQHYEKCAECS